MWNKPVQSLNTAVSPTSAGPNWQGDNDAAFTAATFFKQQLVGNCCNPTDATATQQFVHLWKHTVTHAQSPVLRSKSSTSHPLFSYWNIWNQDTTSHRWSTRDFSARSHERDGVAQTWHVNSQQSSWFHSATPQPPMSPHSWVIASQTWARPPGRVTTVPISLLQLS